MKFPQLTGLVAAPFTAFDAEASRLEKVDIN